MQLAGDSSVSVVGRLFRRIDLDTKNERIVGFCMPLERPIDPSNIPTKDERIRLIHQLRDLVSDLHSKQPPLIHGDIKPQNLLLCSDGRLRFCDFDESSLEGDGFATTRMTYPYCSTFRGRNETLPMTRAEDLHAMAMTMWELYTGRIPLTFGDETLEDADVDDRCLVGFLPDMQLIDDPSFAALIVSCLEAGPDRPDIGERHGVYCVETRFVFGRCRAEPKHTYSRIIHSRNCLRRTERGDGPCRCPFVDPKIFESVLEPICTRCTPGVEYIGLA
ncbi:kinase-like domain-containing protein [Mycena vitilis]|nr:kinase-like domain-containing protein [Mycena vitilis]